MYEFKNFTFASTVLLIGLVCFLWCTDKRLRARYGRILIGLLLVTQAAAFMSPNVLVYNSVAGIALFAVCKERRLIAPVYLFLLLTLPMPTKAIAIGGTYIMGFDAAASLALGASFAVLARAKGSARRSPRWDVLAGIMFLIYAVPSMRDSTITNVLRVTLENVSAILLPYYVVSRSMRSFDDIREALYGFVAGISALCTLAMYEAYRTWPLYRSIPDHYGLSGGHMAVKLRGGLLRTYGPFPESTSFALCLTIGLIVAYGSRRMFASPWKRNIALLVILLGALAPQSRGAWLGLIAGIAAVDLFEGRIGALVKKAVTGGAVIGLLMAGATAIPALRKLPGMSGEGGDTVDYRSQLFDRGVEEIRRFPITGRPPLQVNVAMQDMRQGEGIVDYVNSYIYVGLISGIPGLLAFLYMFGQSLTSLWMAKSSIPRRFLARFRNDSAAGAVFGSMIGMMVMIAVTSMVNRTLTLIVVQLGWSAVILNAMALAQRQTRRAVPPDAAPAATASAMVDA